LQSNTKTHKILRTVLKQTSEKHARATTLRLCLDSKKDKGKLEEGKKGCGKIGFP